MDENFQKVIKMKRINFSLTFESMILESSKSEEQVINLEWPR